MAPARWSATASTPFSKDGVKRPDYAQPYSFSHLHHVLQPRLLGVARRSGKALRTRRGGCAAQRERQVVRHPDEEPVSPGSARNREREGDQDRRTGSEGEARSRNRAAEERLGVESGQKLKAARPAQNAPPAGTDRGRFPRPFPPGPPHPPPLDSASQSPGPSYPP